VPVEIRGGIAEALRPFLRVDAVWAVVVDLDGECGAGLEPVADTSAPDAIEDRWNAAKGGVDGGGHDLSPWEWFIVLVVVTALKR